MAGFRNISGAQRASETNCRVIGGCLKAGTNFTKRVVLEGLSVLVSDSMEVCRSFVLKLSTKRQQNFVKTINAYKKVLI
jgi:hypothetical protein